MAPLGCSTECVQAAAPVHRFDGRCAAPPAEAFRILHIWDEGGMNGDDAPLLVSFAEGGWSPIQASYDRVYTYVVGGAHNGPAPAETPADADPLATEVDLHELVLYLGGDPLNELDEDAPPHVCCPYEDGLRRILRSGCPAQV